MTFSLLFFEKNIISCLAASYRHLISPLLKTAISTYYQTVNQHIKKKYKLKTNDKEK